MNWYLKRLSVVALASWPLYAAHADGLPPAGTLQHASSAAAAPAAPLAAAVNDVPAGAGPRTPNGGPTASATAPPVTLTVVPVGGVGGTGPGQGRYTFGTVDPLQTVEIRHTFTVRNDTGRPVTIDHLVASCHCTHADLQDDGNGKRILAPGQKATVDMAVALPGHHGAIDKFIWLYAPGNDAAVATLEIKATVKDTATISPATLNFGSMAKGTQKTLPLTVTLDARLKQFGAVPDLVSSTPDLKLVFKSETMEPNPTSPTSIVRHYDAVLAPQASRAFITGSIHFASPIVQPVTTGPLDSQALQKLLDTQKKLTASHSIPATSNVTRVSGDAVASAPALAATAPIKAPAAASGPQPTATSAADTLDNVSAQYAGMVTGDVAFEPAFVIVMDAKVGVPAVRHVKITAADQATLAHLTITSPNPAVTTTVTPTPATTADAVPASETPAATATPALPPTLFGASNAVLTFGATADLQVKVLPDTAGPLQVILTVTFPNGQSMLFPIAARVAP